jgi:hypothetical protein
MYYLLIFIQNSLPDVHFYSQLSLLMNLLSSSGTTKEERGTCVTEAMQQLNTVVTIVTVQVFQ